MGSQHVRIHSSGLAQQTGASMRSAALRCALHLQVHLPTCVAPQQRSCRLPTVSDKVIFGTAGVNGVGITAAAVPNSSSPDNGGLPR
jgi:hypothetical protein